MNTNNIITKLQNITKYLSIASLSLGVFNTISNQTTIQNFRNDLEVERKRSFDLTSQVNNLANKENLNQNIEINNNKLDQLTNKINKIIENNLYDNTSLSDLKKSMNEINNDLVEIINKIDESLNNNFIGLDIISQLHSNYSKLNYFQCFALTHLSAFVFIFLSLISLVSLYFGDYFLNKYNIENKYPRIYKYIEIRRKFNKFYVIIDSLIIIIMTIILIIVNLYLLVNY